MSKRNKIFYKPGAKIPSAEEILHYLKDASSTEPGSDVPKTKSIDASRLSEMEEESVSRNLSPSSAQAKEKHAFEKNMLADPFLEEAVEGFALLKEQANTENILQQLNRDIQEKSENRLSRRTVLRVAALLLLLFIGAGITVHLYRQSAMVPEGLVLNYGMDSLAPSAENEVFSAQKLEETDPAELPEQTPAPLAAAPEVAGSEHQRIKSASVAEEQISLQADAPIADSFVAAQAPAQHRNLSLAESSDTEQETLSKKELVPVAKKAKGYSLKEGIDQYNEGAYQEAKEMLEDVLIKQSANQEAIFYKAMADYQLNNYEMAQEAFKKIIKESRHFDEARWYRAQCLVKLGYEEEAIVLFKELAKPGNAYSDKAMEELQQKR